MIKKNTARQYCCIPHCKFLSMRQHHAALITVQPGWLSAIVKYIQNTTSNKEVASTSYLNIRLRSNLICGSHYQACYINDLTLGSTVHFPFLKIAISKTPKKTMQMVSHTRLISVDDSKRGFYRTYTSDEIEISHEVVFPPRHVEKMSVDLSKEKRSFKPKLRNCYWDHTYALTVERAAALRTENEDIFTENCELKKKVENAVGVYEKKLDRLKRLNHQLLRKQSQCHHRNTTKCGDLYNITDHEPMLRFYTGFDTKDKFFKFVSSVHIRLKYTSSHPFPYKVNIGITDQLVLVLCKLRLGLLHHDLAYRFLIPVSTVARIWTFWTRFLLEFFNEEVKGAQGTNKIILECYETFFELGEMQHGLDKKMIYGRTKALLEISKEGTVVDASDLFGVHVSDKDVVDTYQLGKKPERDVQKTQPVDKDGGFSGLFTLQGYIQRILGLIKGFKILKGTFPNTVCGVEQLNNYWRICCFFVNYINQPLSVLCDGNVIKNDEESYILL